MPKYALHVRMRLDAALVTRGLVATRSEASRLIEEGAVLVAGSFAQKSSRLVAPDEAISVVVEKKFVSRGGEKLAHALEVFGINVESRSVLDAGASTGGFTDCVLQRGAQRVLALDVGRNQLHERIKDDARVVWRDGVNVRDLSQSDIDFPCSLIVADLSFISLTKVMASLMAASSVEEGFNEPEMVLLVKPQFEAGRQEVSRGRGVITDPEIHQRAIEAVTTSVEQCGGSVESVVESPIKGAEGNIEFLMWVKCPIRCLGCVS
jgi:23S rRNA (cytidine1920-2'-O)/16S rRNA (cytidine1409-2'-O)-methyltransferase